MLVSGLITVFSITGIISDVFGKGKDNTKKIDISRIKNVGFVIVATMIIIVMWQLLDLFYFGAAIGIGMLLILLDAKEKTKKSVITSLIIAVGMSAVSYALFEFALKIHV
jgi:hypothetical protein